MLSRQPIALMTTALIALSSICCASRPARRAVDALHDQPHVTVMTFNVNYALADDAPTVNAVALGGDADVIFLQETTPAWEAVLRARMLASHPHAFFKEHGGAGGLGVLSRWPLTLVECLPEEDWFPAVR